MDPSRRWAQAIAKAYDLPSHRAERLARPLLEAARAESVPMVLMAALVMAESSYRPFARSHAGAIGPAQVIPRWWADGLCRELDIADPAENLHCGARVLAHYREGCDGDWRCALRRYNVGPGALASGDPGAQAAARRYERKIAENLARFGLRPSL
jgi:soluble lytic murein transglycosylase-like protein